MKKFPGLKKKEMDAVREFCASVIVISEAEVDRALKKVRAKGRIRKVFR